MRIKILCFLLLCYSTQQLKAQQAGFFHTKGKEIISPEGKPFLIKGTNLGNWLVPEGYMFKLQNASSPRLINQAFTELAGPAEMKKFWKKFQEDYIDFRDKYNVPVYVGETGENTDGWVDSFRVVCEQNNIGWHFWPYKKMDNTRGIVSFNKPAGYDSVINYADASKKNFQAIRDLRPKNTQEIKAALDQLLENIAFSKCIANEGYIKALGLNYRKIE